MATELWAIALIIISAIIGAFGAVFLKKGSIDFNLNPFKQITNSKLLFGVFLYGIATIFGIIALKGGELSVLYPFVALNYAMVCILSVKYLGEKMNKIKWFGIAFIILGVVFIGLGS